MSVALEGNWQALAGAAGAAAEVTDIVGAWLAVVLVRIVARAAVEAAVATEAERETSARLACKLLRPALGHS